MLLFAFTFIQFLLDLLGLFLKSLCTSTGCNVPQIDDKIVLGCSCYSITNVDITTSTRTRYISLCNFPNQLMTLITQGDFLLILKPFKLIQINVCINEVTGMFFGTKYLIGMLKVGLPTFFVKCSSNAKKYLRSIEYTLKLKGTINKLIFNSVLSLDSGVGKFTLSRKKNLIFMK